MRASKRYKVDAPITMRQSVIPVDAESDFSLQNLPYGIFSTTDSLGQDTRRVGVRIGQYVLDLKTVASKTDIFSQHQGLDAATARDVFARSTLNAFMSLDRNAWKGGREAVTELLAADGTHRHLLEKDDLFKELLIPITSVALHLPAQIGDYTDFYASKYHASNVGRMLRGENNALMPNWVHLPVAYHGRASSVVVSPTNVVRPVGQLKSEKDETPAFAPCRLLDFELEVGAFFGGPENGRGERIDIDKARGNIFGFVLVNDWSARDIQAWEYVPLGPFLAKSFVTTISPWVVTMEALEGFAAAAPAQDPKPLAYLDEGSSRRSFDINLQVGIKTKEMKRAAVVCRTNYKHIYWTMEQMIAHHSSGGCNMRAGDLLATGTVSGPEVESFASMLELSWRGSKEVSLGENYGSRKFLLDGDEVIISGYAQGEGYRVGFGDCRGTILQANSYK